MVVKNGSDLFSHDFGAATQVETEIAAAGIDKITPEIVEVPRSVAEEMAAGGTTLEYRDVYGGVVNASEVWFIWVP